MDRDARLLDDAVAAFRGRLTDAVGELRQASDALGFCDAERRVQALALALAAEMTQRALQAVSDDQTRAREALERVRERARERGIQVRSEGRRKTLVRTLSGQEVEVTTPYAIGAPRGRGPKSRKRGAQGTGVYPVLDQLGIVGRATPALRLLIARSVSEANSVSAARELLAMGGVEIDHKAALRLTYEVTDDALRARAEAVAKLDKGNDDGPFAGRRVVAAVDGGRVQIRKRVGGRPKKGGRKRFVTEWREPKVLTLYVLGEDGRRDRKVRSVIDGTLGDADAVFELLLYHLRRMGAHKAMELTFVADAAPWIWKRAPGLRKTLGIEAERFHEVVDYFHVVQRLSEFSKSQGWTEEYRLGWYATQKRRLKAGDIEAIEAVFRQISKRDPEELKKQVEYFSAHRERLRYAPFRQRGLPIGSGAVESSVRRVINLRLKGSSVSWTEEHAEGVLHLRAQAKCGRWRELEQAVLGITGWRPTARLRKAPRDAA
ncbi:MAG: hypothetical protein GY913_30580 [Proteobacteria bacterium]|nr:hypothetical protein [Actinomycetes bacterium]MCP4921264.1 hypothetical protein [Pseudomonadota bacterium]